MPGAPRPRPGCCSTRWAGSAASPNPTLVVQGTADQVVAPGNAEVLAGLVPDARLQRFDGAGHLLSWEQPKRFVRIVTDFLTDSALSSARASHSRPPGQLERANMWGHVGREC